MRGAVETTFTWVPHSALGGYKVNAGLDGTIKRNVLFFFGNKLKATKPRKPSAVFYTG